MSPEPRHRVQHDLRPNSEDPESEAECRSGLCPSCCPHYYASRAAKHRA